MVAGALSSAGYFMGDDMIRPTMGNPKGYYESAQVEAINEHLLLPIVPRRPRGLLGKLMRHRPKRYQLWLSRLPVGADVPCPDPLADRIRAAVKQQPFCFKDPRFCYTLPAWRPYLPHTVFVCVFREPAVTADSILKHCRDEPYLQSLSMTFAGALEIWTLMYRHILEVHRQKGQWLFLHYNQVLEPRGLDTLEQLVETKIDRSFPDRALQRTTSSREVPDEVRRTYDALCSIAQYEEPGRQP